MQFRKKPFGEWVLVYFDNRHISADKILNLCKNNGCKRAQIIRGKTAEAGASSAQILNPFLCAGDTIALEIKSDGSEKIELILPDGWTAQHPEKINGKSIIYIDMPKNTKQAPYTIKLKSGDKETALTCDVVRKI